MNATETTFKNSSNGKALLILCVLLSIFWMLTITIDPYSYKIVGIVFEILWLPMLAGLLMLPLLALIFWWKENFNRRSLHVFSLLIVALTVAALNFFPK